MRATISMTLLVPLGVATEYDEGIKRVAVVGGGVGCELSLTLRLRNSTAWALKLILSQASEARISLSSRTKWGKASSHLHICTDDGSYGYHGFVTNKLQELIDGGAKFDEVIAIGPVPMMKFVCKVTKPYDIKTHVSLNPIMIDGTGMCGGCRVTVDGKIKYACVDGPDFDGQKVDFDELMRRNSTYKEQEKAHLCRLTGGVR